MVNLPLNDTGGKFATNTANLPPIQQICHQYSKFATKT
jgi:hypothetical protein